MAYVVVYDACVLHDPAIRDLLIRCATKRQLNFRAHRSDEILDEMVRSILRRRPDLDEHRLQRTREMMNESVADCLVTDFRQLIDAVVLPDPKDRHVVACAIKAQAQAIVTENLSDFPEEALVPFDIEAVHPDEFVLGLFDLNPAVVATVFQEQVNDLRKPPTTMTDAIDIVRQRGLPRTADALGAVLL
ncbi:MAG: PIN domain-containing protein [Acidimicrobiales bacterium]